MFIADTGIDIAVANSTRSKSLTFSLYKNQQKSQTFVECWYS
jgi:hypothetical protein